MKPFNLVLIILLLLALEHRGLCQGTVQFYNRLPYPAPVYGVNPAAPSVRLSGNAPTNGGTMDYTGIPLLSGTTYTASLWGAPLAVTDPSQFELLTLTGPFGMPATTPFLTLPQNAGFWRNPVDCVFVPIDAWGVPGARQFNAQVRVWDNQNGTITSWAQALANPTVGGMGYSEILVLEVARPPAACADLFGLTSFNLTVVPEPSALALGVLCVGALWLARRRLLRKRL